MQRMGIWNLWCCHDRVGRYGLPKSVAGALPLSMDMGNTTYFSLFKKTQELGYLD